MVIYELIPLPHTGMPILFVENNPIYTSHLVESVYTCCLQLRLFCTNMRYTHYIDGIKRKGEKLWRLYVPKQVRQREEETGTQKKRRIGGD